MPRPPQKNKNKNIIQKSIQSSVDVSLQMFPTESNSEDERRRMG